MRKNLCNKKDNTTLELYIKVIVFYYRCKYGSISKIIFKSATFYTKEQRGKRKMDKIDVVDDRANQKYGLGYQNTIVSLLIKA